MVLHEFKYESGTPAFFIEDSLERLPSSIKILFDIYDEVLEFLPKI